MSLGGGGEEAVAVLQYILYQCIIVNRHGAENVLEQYSVKL
jgi:hypothetical protein